MNDLPVDERERRETSVLVDAAGNKVDTVCFLVETLQLFILLTSRRYVKGRGRRH